VVQNESTENDGHVNDGPSKLHDMKMTGTKLQDIIRTAVKEIIVSSFV